MPDRKTTRRQFLSAHWDVSSATDFLTVELENRLITNPGVAVNTDGEVRCRNRLGGLLSYYDREAA